MCLDGYDINTSINTILAESEWAKLRTTREERLEYASRIARVSFGTVGDVTIARLKAEEEKEHFSHGGIRRLCARAKNEISQTFCYAAD